MDGRVHDYLDDKLQSAADFEALDSLLENVKNQQDLLQQQLDDARREHNDAKRKAQQHADSIRQKSQAFQKEQGDIDRRLLIVTQSETSDDAVQKFEASMENLRKLDVAAGYVELLKEVDSLKAESTSNLGKSDEAALEPYKRLQHLVASLQPLQEAAEGAAPHLLDHIVQEVQLLRDTIRKSFSADLEQTLKKMNWPKATDAVPLALEKDWSTNVSRLLSLQRQELEDREHLTAHRQPDEEPPVLFPLEVMVHPLEQRFTYHFSGNKATNRLDKPEYFFSHTMELISAYSNFLQNALQPLLVQQFRGSDLALTPAYIDATTAFITAVLPMLKRKLESVANQVVTQPQLLSHLVHETMSFDMALQDSYAYAPVSPSLPWAGLSYFLLDTCGHFKEWLQVERAFALARYESIIESPDANELDYDSVSSDATKPMKAAIRLNDLLETITDRYRPLSSLHQRLRFLVDIQLDIFDKFYSRLRQSLDAYMRNASVVGRAVTGAPREVQDEVQGIKGLDHLCRVFGSSDYLERAMRDWSDDVFFLELYEELHFQLRNSSQDSHNLTDLHEIQQKTSSVDTGEDSDGELQGALFDEIATAYHRLRERSERMIVEMLKTDLDKTLRSFAAITRWASLSYASASISTSAELDPALRLITEYFGFLSRAVGKIALRRISRQACHAIQSYIWDHVLMRHSFSTAGATQLATDISSLCAHIDRYVGSGQARIGMRKLVEGVMLVSLPIRGEIQRVQPSISGDDEDDDAAWEETNGNVDSTEDTKLGLFQVDRMVFSDNENARQALEQLGVESLSATDAREILKKRIEVGSA